MENKMDKLFDFNKDDISWKLANDAHRNSSMVPDTRADQEQGGYLKFMQSVNDEFLDWVTDENKAAMKSDLAYFKKGYVQRKLAKLNAQTMTASSMITGPSNFNTKSNQKRLDSEHKKLTELLDWSEKILNKMRKEYNPKLASDVIYSDDEQAIQKLESKLEGLVKFQEIMKAANKICRSKKLDPDEKIKQLVDIGIDTQAANELLVPHVFSGNAGFATFELTGNNTKMKNTKKRLEQLKQDANRTDVDICGNGWRLTVNKEVKRIQLLFDGKPTQKIRTALNKQFAFNFARSWDGKPWQRKITQNARRAAKEVVKFLNEQERILEDD